jgi:hypothetical protein
MKGDCMDNFGGAFDYITQYSQLWDQTRKIEDMEKANIVKKNRTHTSFKKLPSSIIDYESW